MKKVKSFGLFVLFVVVGLVLSGCNKADKNIEEKTDEVINPEIIASTENESTSLTNDDLESIIEANFPISYSFSTYSSEDELIDEWEYTYPDDIDHSLLIPEHATMVKREVVDSSVQDGLIYTSTKVTLQDGTILDILYINNPETKSYIAASVKNGNTTVNYQFNY